LNRNKLFNNGGMSNGKHMKESAPVTGYRDYFKEIEGKIIILLVGGDKSTQQKDIDKAKDIWKKLKK